MANTDIDAPRGVTERRRARGFTGASPLTSTANQDSVSVMRARLTAINATSYTTARLDSMTKNDMMYAIRLNDDAAGI